MATGFLEEIGFRLGLGIARGVRAELAAEKVSSPPPLKTRRVRARPEEVDNRPEPVAMTEPIAAESQPAPTPPLHRRALQPDSDDDELEQAHLRACRAHAEVRIIGGTGA